MDGEKAESLPVLNEDPPLSQKSAFPVVVGCLLWEKLLTGAIHYQPQKSHLQVVFKKSQEEIKMSEPRGQCPKCGEPANLFEYPVFICIECGIRGSKSCCNPGGRNALCIDCDEVEEVCENCSLGAHGLCHGEDVECLCRVEER